MPTLPDKPFDDYRECGLWQENGTCERCLALRKNHCLLKDQTTLPISVEVSLTSNDRTAGLKNRCTFYLSRRAIEEVLCQIRSQMSHKQFHDILKHTSEYDEAINIPAEKGKNEKK